MQLVVKLRGGGFSTGKGGFGRPVRDGYVPVPGEWQCNVCHATRCWGTRNTCYKCGCPKGADGIVVLETASPGLTVGPLGRVAATSVNPSDRVSTPGAGVGGFSGGKGVVIPKRREVWLRFTLWEVYFLPRFRGGGSEVIKAVDLLGGVLAGLGIDIEALKPRCAIPPPPSRMMLLRQDVCWHKSFMSARRRWNSFRRSFRLGFIGPLSNWRMLGVL